MESIGSVVETFHNLLGIGLEWKIPEFFNLSSDVGCQLRSPSFEYCSKTWYLVVFPNGHNIKGSDSGYSSIELRKSTSTTPSKKSFLFTLRSKVPSEISFLFTLGIKKADTSTEVILCDQGFPANDCGFWHADKFMQTSELLRRRSELVPSGVMTITCTLHSNGQHLRDSAPEMIERHEGSIQEVVCSSHKHVLWSIDYEPLRKDGTTESPSFSIDNQRYLLMLHTFEEHIKLMLFRKGPSVDSNVCWWAGLKRGDGSYHHVINNGKLCLEEECELWMNVEHLHSFISWELEKSDLATDGRLIFFVRMNMVQAQTGEARCTHDVGAMRVRGEGSIREEMCPSHKSVLWKVGFRSLLESDHPICSPCFDMGNQSYLLELKRSQECTELNLFRMGPPGKGYVRFWASIDRNTVFFGAPENGKFYQREECELWTAVQNLGSFNFANFWKADPSRDRHISFSFFMKLEEAALGWVSCNHSAPETVERSKGSIREEVCFSHKHVLWSVDFEELREDILTVSPSFTVDNQTYLLMWTGMEDIRFRLIRKGPSVDRNVRWWAGLKCGDGSYHHVIKNGNLHLEYECELWREVMVLHSFISSELEKSHVAMDGRITFFFRMNVVQAQTEEEICTHDAAAMAARSEGSIREEMCPSHKSVSWNVSLKSLDVNGPNICSPSFNFGKQSYLLGLKRCQEFTELNLLRIGPSVKGFVQYWTRPKFGSKKLFHSLGDGKFYLQEEFKLWTAVKNLDTFSSYDLRRSAILDDCHITFFLFMKLVQGAAPTWVTCNHRPAEIIERADGSIREEVCSSHKQVLWSVDYKMLGYCVTLSPSFSIDNQSYLLMLQASTEGIKLKLMRKGPSVDRDVPWWAGLKLGDGSYHYLIMNGNLPLDEECKLWTDVENLGSFISSALKNNHVGVDGCIAFFFRMNIIRAETGEQTCIHDVTAMTARGEGSIREEICPTHKCVCWDLSPTSLKRGGAICSPSFDVGKQTYLLELNKSVDLPRLSLFRTGSSVEGNVQWCAGFRIQNIIQWAQNGTFYLQQECELWTSVDILCSFHSYEFGLSDMWRNSPVTFFIFMKWEQVPLPWVICDHEAQDVSSLDINSFGGEVCISHENAEWRLSHLNRMLISKKAFKFISQEFRMGSQRYKLELSSPESSRWVNLILYRKGPSISTPSRFIRWWIKLVRGDGSSDRVKGELDLKEHCEIWTQTNLHRTTRFAIYSNQRLYRFPFRACTINNKIQDRMSVVFTAKSTQDAVEMPVEGDGTIDEDDCPSHKHIRWCIDNIMLLKDFTSPEFEIGSQRYRLQFTFMDDGRKLEIPVNLHLISRESQITYSSQSVRWCAGVMCTDRVCNYENVSGRLNLKKGCDVWTQKLLHTVLVFGTHLRRSVDKFTIFFCVDNRTDCCKSMECILWGYREKDYNFCRRMKEDVCSHHKHVEWISGHFHLFLGETYNKLMSPSFDIAGQRYLLQFKSDGLMLIELNLYILGSYKRPSRSVRWWAGFKRADGTYLMNSSSGVLNPRDVWTRIWTHKCLLTVHKDEFRQERLAANQSLTIFFRMNLDRAETEADKCEHSDFQLLPSLNETVLDVEYYPNKEIELQLHNPESMDGDCWTSNSIEFAVGTQLFYFRLSCAFYRDCPQLMLHLYSRGPAETGYPSSARWWAGLKRDDRTYYHRNLSGKLNLKDTCSLWTLRGSQQFVFSKFARDLLSIGGQLYTVFFRLSEEAQASNAAEEYIPGIVEITSACGVGEIDKEDYAFYTQVNWTALYDPLEGEILNVTSHVFKIGDQDYKLELSQDLDDINSIMLCLYRWGSSVTGPAGVVQWWAGFKRGNKTYDHRTQRGELDLRIDCDLWTQIHLHRVCRYKLERELLTADDQFTLFFRLSKEQQAKVFTHSSDVAHQDRKRLRRDDNTDVIFKVKGKEFKMSGTYFLDQIPVFTAMFKHDTTEKRTGMVSVEDIEPDVFEEFLHYVSTGFLRELTAVNVHALYVAADRYLVHDLKAQCLQYMSDTLSVKSFFDVVTLALNYREDDLMKETINFFSRNQNITETNNWHVFYRCNPDVANELQLRAFLPP